MADFQSLGVRLQTLLSIKSISQATLASQIGSSKQTVNNITGGTHLPRMNVIEEIYNVFPDLNLHWFLTGEGNMWTEGSLNEKATHHATQDLFKYQQNLIVKLNDTINKLNITIAELETELKQAQLN